MTSASIRLLRRQPYNGSQIGIVIGIDVGTTFSGVSYAVLRPGEVPEVQPVTRFSGQSVGAGKIPSIIYYDDDLTIKAIGASTVIDSVVSDADYYGWFKSQHFKMHLRPNTMHLQTNGLEIGELPNGRSAEQVMGDFLRYLLAETINFIQTAHTDGDVVWRQVKDRAIFVLGHPNGWTGLSQQRYRQSAILGGLILGTAEDRNRVKFVTEGEASALACLSGGLGPANLEAGFKFVVADAGGGTLDMCSYEVTRTSPLELKECAPADCRFAGSVFVDKAGLELLKRKLKNSKYDDEETLKAFITDEFEKKTKREFDGDVNYGLMKVGDRRAKDDKLGIRGGFLRLDSDELSECFSLSVTEALDSIRKQLTATRRNNAKTSVWLVGGFASSAYLLKRLDSCLGPEGVSIQRPDTNLAKAVANGAVLHFLDHLVTSRVCPASYGTTCLIPYNPLLPDHRERSDLLQTGTEGAYIGPVFDCIVAKGTPIEEAKAFKESYFKEFFLKSSATQFATEILVYDGDLPLPRWYKENKQADLSELCTESSRNTSMLEFLSQRVPRAFWKAKFEIELKFGTTELEAKIKWEANVCSFFVFL
ncbi:hypothetical protein DFH11DRAFT_1503934 [Phellopilus nigrolimitatus]|nr:hypothetical protein DFH11DRAFT_1503934 [Phellopilus nigrolimitatus]